MIHLRTLGALDLRDPGGREIRSILAQPKRLALLLYLSIAEPRRFQRRDRLLALFWPGLDQSHARNSLSQALTTLRRGLGSGVLVTRGDEEVGLNPGTLDCDVVSFEALLAQGRRAEALERYRGDFLDGFHLDDVAPEFERWLEDERTRLRTLAVGAALELSRAHERPGEVAVGLEWARRASAMAPRDEAAVGAHMRLLAMNGDRAGALLLYREFALWLEAELELQPSAELRAIADEIRDDATEIRAGGPLRSPDGGSDLPARSMAPDLPMPEPAERAGTAEIPGPIGPDGGAPWSDDPLPPEGGVRARSRFARRDLRPTTLLVLLLCAGAAVALALEARDPGQQPAESDRHGSVAVLPFESLCADSGSQSLVGGLHTEVVTQLSRVTGLRVSSRASVQRYAGDRPPSRVVAAELEVGALLEGTVQCAGQRIRVSVQLVDAAADRNLWAERYDGDRGDLFAVQTEIAQAVADALHAHLTPDQRAALQRPPTGNERAYEAYLQARDYHRRPAFTEEDARAAERLYLHAVELDPTFALAHARLASLHGFFYQIGWDRSPARLSAWWEASETALRLQPDLPEAHFARASYWSGQREFDRALAELRVALVELDTDSEVHQLLGQVHCRMSRWDECLAEYRRAAQLDPRAAAHHVELGYFLWVTRRYPESVAALDRALELAPDYHLAALYRGRVFVDWLDTTDSLAAALLRLPLEWDPDGVATINRFILAWLERRPADGLAALDSSRHDALTQFRYEVPFSLLRGQAYAEAGAEEAALTSYREAMGTLEALVEDDPEAAMRHLMLGWAYAGVGRKEDAMRQVALAKELEPLSRDAVNGAGVLEHAAQIHAQLGEVDVALREVELLLTVPSPVSVARLRREARWDPLRSDPRFQRMLRGGGGGLTHRRGDAENRGPTSSATSASLREPSPR